MNTTIVIPTQPRYTTARDAVGSLVIILPSRRSWLLLIPNGLFVVVWLALLLAAVVGGGSALLRTALAQPSALVEFAFPALFILIWLGVFSLGGLTALYTLLWGLAGREVIEVNRRALRLSRVIPGWQRTKEYSAADIKDLRVSPQILPVFYRRRSNWPGAQTGQLAFDYGARTIRFADADEAEAKMILAEIRQRYPQYGEASQGSSA